MKFGPVAVAQTQGLILAHSVQTPKGRLRKGHVITAADVQVLQRAGLGDVICAQPDAEDVGENLAAAQLGGAVLGGASGMTLSAPFTGRTNVIADGPGVAVLDVAALEAVNLVHPMITIATVPAFQQMQRGGLIATIKIISYAVPGEALAQACIAVGSGAIEFAAPKLRSATLIVTEIEKGPGDKGRAAIEGRLNALGVVLDAVVMVPHRAAPLAAAIAAVASDLVLILTGSATSDIEDVAPSALRMAGGEVTRFGMPVDPGNLLFLGHLAARPVIGLPGCARSPALNGADWVLARVVCGLNVSAREIAQMGVGGLLKEIATRPQPRRGR